MVTTPTGSLRTQPQAERLPPQDPDAEMALLGAMMMGRDAIAEAIPIIGREDSAWFYLPVHQKLFEVLLDLYDDPAKAIDLIVVSDELKRRDLLDFVPQEYMIQLAESFAEWSNAEHYAKIVRDKGMLRDLIRCAGEIAEEAYAGVDEARDILDTAEQRIFTVTERRISGQAVAIRQAIARLKEQLHRKDEGGCTGLPTGFHDLDEYTGGFQFGDFIIVAGRPSMGKTALGLTMSQNMAVGTRAPVAFFSMEMSKDQLVHRLICGHSGVDSQRLRRRMLSEENIHDLLTSCAAMEDAPLFIDDTPGMTAMELRSKARRLKQRADIQAVFVDYLQLMHTPRAENRQVEMATISRGLKSLARELNIPVIAMAQLNRMPEGRQDKRPLMSDLRESGAIEQDADVVLLIHREEYYKPDDESAQGKAELIIAKQRNGPTGRVELQFDKKRTTFRNLSVVPEPYGMDTEAVPF
ncbi:MAG: replicative DNA helicase [Planctomycetes bacterium]|nr:replicative DNA helicase [Planctomycetota bacterium]